MKTEIITTSKAGKDLLVRITFDDGVIYKGWVDRQ